MAKHDTIFIGIAGTIVALDPSTGSEMWSTSLKGRSFVNVAVQGKIVIATTRGEIFALDRSTGHIVWNNPLKGLGMGFVTIAGAAQSPVMSAVAASQNDGGAAAAGAAAASS